MLTTTTAQAVSEGGCVIVATTDFSAVDAKTRRSTKRRRATFEPPLTGEIRCHRCHRRFRPEPSLSGKNTYLYCGGTCAWKSLRVRLELGVEPLPNVRP